MNNYNNNILYHPLNLYMYSPNLNPNPNPFLLQDNNEISNNLNPFLNNKIIGTQDSINFNDKNNNNIKDLEKKKQNKFLLFFKSHNFTNDNDIIKRDEQINEDKKFYDLLSYTLEDDMKCCICLSKYKEPLLCPNCHHFVCRNCLQKWYDQDKGNCVYCRKDMDFDSFIEIPAFRTILPFLDLLKINNDIYFNDILQNNIDKQIVLCSNKIHQEIDDCDKKNNDNNNNDKEIDKEKKYINKMNEIKASYYCFDCNKPYCSDCICLIDDNNNNNEHKNDHFAFNIDILNEIKYFDLLYEKENNKTIEKLNKTIENINEGIDKLNKNKNNILLFIEYIKNTYIGEIDKKINKLKDFNKKCESEINKVKKTFDEINELIKVLKSTTNIKNTKNIKKINHNLNLLNNFDKSPEKIKLDINNVLKFKGLFKIKDNYEGTIKINAKNFQSERYDLTYNISLIITKDNFKGNANKNIFLSDYNKKNDSLELSNNDNNNENNNKYKLLLIVFGKNNNRFYINDLNNEFNNKGFFPILFDNENNHIIFDEIKVEDDFYLLKEPFYNQYQNNIFYNPDNNFKYFRTYVELDKLIVNNENNNFVNDESNNSKNINNNNSNKMIKICLYSLNLY